jgi:hypothetical protein
MDAYSIREVAAAPGISVPWASARGGSFRAPFGPGHEGQQGQ